MAESDEALLLGFVADRDVVCPVCSYNLRGLQRAVCPECAARLHLAVGSENLRLGAWFPAVVAFALALGFDGVVSLLILTVLILHPPPSAGTAREPLTILAVLAVLGAASAVGLATMLRRRSAWFRMSLARQRAMAVVTFAGTGLVHALAGLLLMRLV